MKTIRLGAFEINGLNLTSQGLWARPDQNTYRYTDLDYWIDLARTLERGRFDFLFLADSYGYPVIDGQVPGVALEQGAEIPKNDPMLLIPALAAATTNLCFAVTASTSFEAPFANARRFGTLDHLTKGRIAWNVVTTSSTIVTELFGKDRFVPHDERYAIAAEYLDVSYQLFEGSWDDDAVVCDKERRLYADPSKVRAIAHHGRYFDVEGYFNVEPSPQRTPVIFQAGASPAGMAFAARNAEVVFLQGKDATTLKAQVTKLRQLTEDAGRDPRSITTLVGLSAVVAPSRADAQRKLDDYLSWVHPDAARVYYAFMTGIDLTALDPDVPVSSLTTEQSRTQVDRYRDKTARQAAEDFIKHGMREFILLGNGREIAEQMAELVTETDIDGFNYTPFVSPGSYVDFADHVVPELQRLGMVSREPQPAPAETFRERLTGSRRLPLSHPARRYSHDVEALVTP